jgi:hypothetical protein
MLIDLESANKYFLCPLENEINYEIGDKDAMNYMAYLMKEGDVISVIGITNDDCYLMTDWDDAKCIRMIKKMKKLMKERAKIVVEGELEDEHKD